MPPLKEPAVREVSINSLDGLIGMTDWFDVMYETIIFRGQTEKGNLLPSVARKNPAVDTSAREKELLDQLKLMGASLLPIPELNTLDLLVLAQHFGLKTRLLDWTSNPLAALWFACADPKPGPVFVYALGADSHLVRGVYGEDPFGIPKTLVFQPRLNNPRIIAQHGWFTLHPYSSETKSFIPLDLSQETEQHLTEICIPEASRDDIRHSLARYGISGRTLFPDLQGLCEHLNWENEKT